MEFLLLVCLVVGYVTLGLSIVEGNVRCLAVAVFMLVLMVPIINHLLGGGIVAWLK